jgi:hypothetical protein
VQLRSPLLLSAGRHDPRSTFLAVLYGAVVELVVADNAGVCEECYESGPFSFLSERQAVRLAQVARELLANGPRSLKALRAWMVGGMTYNVAYFLLKSATEQGVLILEPDDTVRLSSLIAAGDIHSPRECIEAWWFSELETTETVSLNLVADMLNVDVDRLRALGCRALAIRTSALSQVAA